MSVKSFISVAALATVIGVGWLAVSTASAQQITIPTVTIGNPGNAPDPFTGNLYGSVAYTYNIGTTEVTNAQYAAFLNAKAASDTYDLYYGDGTSTGMASSLGGITRSGSWGSYTYATVSGRENNPVNFVSFWSATRFANWLHNGQGSGDTETGAYTLTPGGMSGNTITRNAGWQWAVTSEDEWYKAGYHQPASAGGDSDNYWLYPTQSNALPTTAQANFGFFVVGNTTPVGSYVANYYGAFDMGGNVWEWNEAIVFRADRGVRGGSYTDGVNSLWAYYRANISPRYRNWDFGFRVVQAVAAQPLGCDKIDFNNNGVFPEDQDVFDFFDVLAGGTPATCDAVQGCNDIDFNNNGVFPEDQDVFDLFNVLAGGTCP